MAMQISFNHQKNNVKTNECKKPRGIPSSTIQQGVDNSPFIVSQQKKIKGILGNMPVSKPIVQRKISGVEGENYSSVKGKIPNASLYVDGLVKEAGSKVGSEDKVLTTFTGAKDINVTIAPYCSAGYYPARKEIDLDPNIKFPTHETRDRIFNDKKPDQPEFDKIGVMKISEGVPIGRLSLATTLYHELGHAYQHQVQELDFDMYTKHASGKFMIELHNMLQTENKAAYKNNEPLRSTYRSIEGVKDLEAPEFGKKYERKKSMIVEKKDTSDDQFVGAEITSLAKKIVFDYHEQLTKWVNNNAKGMLTEKELASIKLIIDTSLSEAGDNMRESQIHLLQGIIDSMYYYVRNAIGTL